MNITMWRKALQVIPHVSKDEWRKLDVSFQVVDLHPGSRLDHDLSSAVHLPVSLLFAMGNLTWLNGCF